MHAYLKKLINFRHYLGEFFDFFLYTNLLMNIINNITLQVNMKMECGGHLFNFPFIHFVRRWDCKSKQALGYRKNTFCCRIWTSKNSCLHCPFRIHKEIRIPVLKNIHIIVTLLSGPIESASKIFSLSPPPGRPRDTEVLNENSKSSLRQQAIESSQNQRPSANSSSHIFYAQDQ